MRKRTPSEIKAYGDGYAEAYKQFQYLIERYEIDIAVRKMKIFADAVALTVETATDTADTPQTDCDTCKHDSDQWYSEACDGCSKADSNYEPTTEESSMVAVVKPYTPTNREILDALEKSDCPWK